MKNAKYWKEWCYCAGVRAVKTMSQSAIAAIGGATVFSQVDAKVVVSTALLAGVLSLLMSIAGLPEVNKN